MGLGKQLGLVVVIVLALVAVPQLASGKKTRVYNVSLTIAADQAKGTVGGKVSSGAPDEFCNSSKLRIRQVMSGKDHVIAKVKPKDGQWHLKLPGSAHGERVYVEVSRYELPSRPVVCRAATSHRVTAP